MQVCSIKGGLQMRKLLLQLHNPPRQRRARVDREEGQSEAGNDRFHNNHSYALSVRNVFNSHVKLKHW